MKKLYTTLLMACCTVLYTTAQYSPELVAAKEADRQASLAANTGIPPSQPMSASCSGGFISLLIEEFESGQPAGWTFTVSDGGAWAFNTSTNGINSPISGSWAVVDDNANNNIGIAVATSPVLDVNGTTVEVSFYYDMQAFLTDGGDLFVEFWDGTNWQFVDQANAFSTTSTKFCDDDCAGNITLTADAGTFGNSDFQFRFTYSDEGEGAWGFGFDDVSVCAEVICNNALQGGQFPALAVTPNPTGVTTIDNCNNEDQYSVIEGIVASTNYQFTSTGGGGYITVTTGAVDGAVVAAGYSPVDVTALNGDDLYVHWTADEFCTAGSTCITTTVENLGAACLADAGTLTADVASVCLYQGAAIISATLNGDQVVPAGYVVQGVLADASGTVISGGSFSHNVTVAGDYYIHVAVIAQADALAYQSIASIADAHALTIDGGGLLCGSIDQTGVLVTVVACPDNDQCANAEAITCGVTVTGTTTLSTDIDALTCHEYEGVWYSFVGDGSLVNISTDHAGTDIDTYLAISETCGGACLASNDDGGSGNTSLIELFQTTAGQTYYINVTGWWTLGDFELSLECGAVAPTPPANDLCIDAETITCGVNVTGTTKLSNAVGALTCRSTYNGVWYSFVGDGSMVNISTDYAATNFDTHLAVSETCGGTCVASDDDGGSGSTSLIELFQTTLGQTYYINVTGWNSTGGDFELSLECGAVAPTPPANDDCAGATVLTVGATCNSTAGTTKLASQSLTGCTGYADDDVWYSFTATAESATVLVQGSANFDAVFEVFSGVCGSLVSLECVDGGFTGEAESTGLTTLTIGETYYVRVYHWGSSAPSTPTFDICVYDTPPPPANDECAGATVLTVGATCNSTTGTTASATESLPGCDGYADDDVWYSFTATAESATVLVQGSANFDAVFEVFSGACGSLVSLECVDNTASGNAESTDLTTLTIGETYYVRVYHWSSSASSIPTFDICVYDTPLPPANDECAGAESLVVGASCSTISGTVEASTSSLAGCSGTADQDVWFSFVAVTTEATVEVTGSANFDAVLEVFEGSCGTLTSMECEENSGDGATESVSLTSLVPGNTYYARVYDYWGAGAPTKTFDICVYSLSVGIQDNLENSLSLYPNPSNGQFVVEVNGVDADAQINVMDVTGRMVYTEGVTMNGSFRKELNLEVAKGTYLLQIATVEGMVTRKIQIN